MIKWSKFTITAFYLLFTIPFFASIHPLDECSHNACLSSTSKQHHSHKGVCLTALQRAQIKEKNQASIKNLSEENIIKELNKNLSMDFIWPVQASSSMPFKDFYMTTNYVDQNFGNGTLDFNCGNITYDGHRGIDISTWPFQWYLYENEMAFAVAAASGTIIGKDDGNFDQNCNFSNAPWNAVYVMHDDGSQAWYGHLKSSSLTSKVIGDRVNAGEYLGVIGSSGSSTASHLHFEVYDNNDNLVDPYQGNCNSLNSQSWWANQKSYEEPGINALTTHFDWPLLGCPAGEELTNFKNDFDLGDNVYFSIFGRHFKPGQGGNLLMKRPDGSVFTSIEYSHSEDVFFPDVQWNAYVNIPFSEMEGLWTLETIFGGETIKHDFNVGEVNPVVDPNLSFVTFINGCRNGVDYNESTQRITATAEFINNENVASASTNVNLYLATTETDAQNSYTSVQFIGSTTVSGFAGMESKEVTITSDPL